MNRYAPRKSNRTNSLLTQYLDESSQYSLLSKEEEIDLAQKVQAGDVHARNTLISSNLKLVVNLAKRYERPGVDILDLVQAGNEKLCDIVNKYDPTRDTRFSTFASYHLRNTFARYVMNMSSTVRIPVHIRYIVGSINRVQPKFYQENARHPTPSEIAEILHTSLENVDLALRWTPSPLSLDHVANNGSSMYDFIPKVSEFEEITSEDDKKRAVQKILARASLSKNQRHVIRHRFGLANQKVSTLKQVGQTLQRTDERVRQIQNEAITELRRASGPLRDYLGL